MNNYPERFGKHSAMASQKSWYKKEEFSGFEEVIIQEILIDMLTWISLKLCEFFSNICWILFLILSFPKFASSWVCMHTETPASPQCRQQGNVSGTLSGWCITEIIRFLCKHATEQLQLLPSWPSQSHIPTVRIENRNICCVIGCSSSVWAAKKEKLPCRKWEALCFQATLSGTGNIPLNHHLGLRLSAVFYCFCFALFSFMNRRVISTNPYRGSTANGYACPSGMALHYDDVPCINGSVRVGFAQNKWFACVECVDIWKLYYLKILAGQFPDELIFFLIGGCKLLSHP